MYWYASNKGSRLCRRSIKVWIKRHPSLQKDACQTKQSVCDTAQGTSVRVATFA
jgi:hypothetical protein